jgi:hypothetical protein
MASLAPKAAVYEHAGCILFYHLKLQNARAGFISSTFIKSLKFRTVHRPVSLMPEWTKMPMPDWSRNKGTRRYRNAPVPEWDADCRNANAGGIGLYAGAQLFKKEKENNQIV